MRRGAPNRDDKAGLRGRRARRGVAALDALEGERLLAAVYVDGEILKQVPAEQGRETLRPELSYAKGNRHNVPMAVVVLEADFTRVQRIGQAPTHSARIAEGTSQVFGSNEV